MRPTSCAGCSSGHIPPAKPIATSWPSGRSRATADELREFLAPRFAKWWLPERFEFVDEIPKTSVGKFRKTALREQFATEPAQTPTA